MAGKIPAGTQTDQAFCLTDVFASVADIVQASLPKNTAEDSFNFWPVWQGNTTAGPVRPSIVHQSGDGMLALRQGDWKYVEALGSGGFTEPKRVKASAQSTRRTTLRYESRPRRKPRSGEEQSGKSEGNGGGAGAD